jgi:hypothetical protein
VREQTKTERERGRGLGPFSGRQLTLIIVVVSISAAIAIPTAALAAAGAFSNNSATVPAVQGTNSNALGIGVQGTGHKYGVFSNGPLGVAAGKSLSCTGCVGAAALSAPAKKGTLIYQNDAFMSGPWDGRTTKAAFAVPSGLMCLTGSMTSSTRQAGRTAAEFILMNGGQIAAQVDFLTFANNINTHMSLTYVLTHVGLGNVVSSCFETAAATYTIVTSASSDSNSDGNDIGNLFVQVFSQ